MKVKTSNLIGPALDWAVARSEGLAPFSDGISWIVTVGKAYRQLPKYSTDWAQGGPIIERERLCIGIGHSGVWLACSKQNYDDAPEFMNAGSTPLISAMRCVVASTLGDEVEVPNGLVKE